MYSVGKFASPAKVGACLTPGRGTKIQFEIAWRPDVGWGLKTAIRSPRGSPYAYDIESARE